MDAMGVDTGDKVAGAGWVGWGWWAAAADTVFRLSVIGGGGSGMILDVCVS